MVDLKGTGITSDTSFKTISLRREYIAKGMTPTVASKFSEWETEYSTAEVSEKKSREELTQVSSEGSPEVARKIQPISPIVRSKKKPT